MQNPSLTSTSSQLCFQNADVVMPDGTVKTGAVVVDNGTIDYCDFKQAPALESATIIDASGCYLTPGLIDAHFNGALGVGFNHASEQAMVGLFEQLPQHGITAVMPTLITAPKADLVHQVMLLEGIIISTLDKHSSRIVGLHLEGPFINPDYRGAHPKEHILPLTKDHCADLLSPNTRRVTIAPEMGQNLSFIPELTEKGIACAIGHTGADADMAQRAIAAGATYVTHLFNAMRSFHHREPGVAFACLMDERTTIELIADGYHLAPETIDLILRLKSHDKLVVTTDSNPLAGLKPGTQIEFGGQTIRVENNQTVNGEGKLAGSHLFLADHVRNLVKWGLLPFEKAVQLATGNPARYLGVEKYIGEIRPNAVADLILWDKKTLSIKQVFVAGQPVLTR